MKYFNNSSSGETSSSETAKTPTPTPTPTPSSSSSTPATTETAKPPITQLISSLNKQAASSENGSAKVTAKPLGSSSDNNNKQQQPPLPSAIKEASQSSIDTTTPSVIRRQVRIEPAPTPSSNGSHHQNGNENNNSGNSNGSGGTKTLSSSNASSAAADRKSKVKSVYYQSKYKYINGKAAHKNEHITNIRNLSTMWPSECNGFQINTKHAAILLAGTSGQIGIVELNKPGRLADTTINSIVNKSKVSDFAWDPFDDESLAAACDDGVIRIWKIPEDGLEASLEEPHIELRGHLERLYCIKYHPYAKNVLATASYDRTIRLWNVKTKQTCKVLKGHTDVVFSMCWSVCGNRLATICKDGILRVYEPLVSDMPIVESKCGPAAGSKAARIEWVLNDRQLLVSGFGK